MTSFCNWKIASKVDRIKSTETTKKSVKLSQNFTLFLYDKFKISRKNCRIKNDLYSELSDWNIQFSLTTKFNDNFYMISRIIMIVACESCICVWSYDELCNLMLNSSVKNIQNRSECWRKLAKDQEWCEEI